MKAALVAFALVLLINCGSCAIVRLAFGGRFTIVYPAFTPERCREPQLYLIAGLKSQPAQAYHRFNFSNYRPVYCCFSYLGYNPFRAGRQLTSLVQPGEIVCGLSIGAKAVECSKLPPEQAVVLINPCSYPQLLNRQRRIYPYIKYLAPFAEIGSFLIGWVAVLPLLEDRMGDRLSLALFIDQLFWIGYGQPRRPLTKRTGVVISQQDEWMPPERQREHYQAALCTEIAAPHGRIANRHYYDPYSRALRYLLEQLSGA